MRQITENDYTIDSDTGCWIWQRGMTNDGHGIVSFTDESGKHTTPAHRFHYEQELGPIPNGLVLDHTCRNRACVNPEHLEPVTRAVNNQRGLKAKLTSMDVRDIRSRFARGHRGMDLATEFGVHPVHISRIVNYHRWKEEVA